MEWYLSWENLFQPGWSRSLWAAKRRRHPYNRDKEIQEATDEGWRRQLQIVEDEDRRMEAKWNAKVIARQLPPYPESMQDMYPPNHYMDEEGNWIEFDTKPMYELLDFVLLLF
ncbi:hypothetical protein EV356DRAFT_503860 [Viridothelium virens]|uniref:Uncharacterized protein n=1 Tax=Viridothelium virens TaxID=1048519 RepID=A0A6A6H617_VIRVR|nr:hypothetical protein EV356DRAFT_503860 [Viridothelium virens]